MNNYYDIRIKKYYLNELNVFANNIFIKRNLADRELIMNIFKEYNSSIVINLVVQVGLR